MKAPIWAISLCVMLVACGDDPKPVTMSMPECVSGTSFSCSGPGGCAGTQACINTRLTACTCRGNVPPPPDSGMGMMGDGSVSMMDAQTHDDAMVSGDGDGDGDAPGDGDGDGDDPQPGDEDCDNGVDDDGDDDVDCADDDCGASMCVPEAPANFRGPFVAFIGSGTPPSCVGAYGEETASGGAGLDAPDADCSTCTCDAESSDCANHLIVQAGDSASCNEDCPVSFNLTCDTLTSPCLAGLSTGHAKAVVPASAGGCEASAQTPDLDDATFAQHARGCAPSDDLARNGCEGGMLCAPPGPFDGPFCVARDGDHSCPAGPYSVRHLFYGDIDDDRDCTPCECSKDCNYKLDVYAAADDTCEDDPLVSFEIDQPSESEAESECEEVTPASGGKLLASATITGSGDCDASGGEPEGEAVGTDPVTFCCLP